MIEGQNSYRTIFRATSIFGGVQLFNMIISLVRGKALAILIGTGGMGLNGLFLTGLNLIKAASSMGIEQSAIRDISAAHATGDHERINRTFSIFRRWVWITAGLGMILTLSFSPLLSRFSFGSGEHKWSYMLLSFTFIFGALTGGIYTLLIGTRSINTLAQSNILGSFVGLIVALPIFYFYGIKGVVPAILFSSLSVYLVSLYFRRKIRFQKVKINFRDTLKEGGSMIKLGISLSVSSLMGAVVNYVLLSIITRTGSINDAGLYNAGMTIVGTYVGMVFSAMGTDYFPRLAGVIHDEMKWKSLLNQQAEMVILILGPILSVLLGTAPILIRFILSAEFLPTIDFLTWALPGILLKGVVWVMGFVVISKGENKLFLLTETIGNLYVLGLNILFYHIFGLKGLGISFFVGYLLSVIMMVVVLKRKYNFQFQKKFTRLVGVVIILLLVSVICIILMGFPNAYFTNLISSLIIIVISVYGLNKRLNLIELIKFAIHRKE